MLLSTISVASWGSVLSTVKLMVLFSYTLVADGETAKEYWLLFSSPSTGAETRPFVTKSLSSDV